MHAVVFINLTYIFGMLTFLIAEDIFTDMYVENSSITYMVSPRVFILGIIPALALTYLVHKLDEKARRRKPFKSSMQLS